MYRSLLKQGKMFVSIPHRQAKNPRLHGLLLVGRGVSIPHRQAKNVNTPTACGMVSIVSIPHRQAKNEELASLAGYDEVVFQFLIGRLKTPAAIASVGWRYESFNSS
ncbi:MAG: hypothetical protein XD78_1245 [Desulfotomaculum sp. 46_296]|nr:MAG: hypothetical protein XD78_1245 [Desulfotomaculum sp. 46_296]